MKTTLLQITDNFEAMLELSKIKMPIKASYRISCLFKKLAPEIETYNEKRDGLLKEMGKPQENGTSYLIEKENVGKFNEELKKIHDIEINLDFEKIKIAELGEINIEPRLLIDWIFE